MGRRRGGQAGRGADAANAESPRCKANRVGSHGEPASLLSTDVPFFLVGNKKSARYGEVSARRALMKARMSLRSGTTGFGCALGYIATISYPPTEQENLLLESMGAPDLEGAGAADLVGEAAVHN